MSFVFINIFTLCPLWLSFVRYEHNRPSVIIAAMASDQRFLSAALEQLKQYLLSNEIFWNLGTDPQLTLGNLLLAEASLKGAGKLSASDSKALAAQKKEWRSAWEKKAEKEFAARLRQWTEYLSELSENPSRHAAYYGTEVRTRALLELLAQESPGSRGQLAAADSQLKALTINDNFVWEAEVKGAFPKSSYWFLYVKPKGK